MRVTLDFETANTAGCDLSVVGAVVYWEHPATEILCLCAITDDGGEIAWLFGPEDQDCSLVFAHWALDPTVIFEAHSVAFEQYGWKRLERDYGMPPVPIERWDDTMARAYYKGLPGGLDAGIQALGLPEQKDKEGRALTLSLSKPMTAAAWAQQIPADWQDTKAAWNRRFQKGSYDRSAKTIRRVAQYCAQDCRAEVSFGHAVGDLSLYERRVWELDQRINQRGLRVDREYIGACQKVVAQASVSLADEFSQITSGLAVGQVAKVLEWCNDRGAKLPSLGKDVLKARGITGIDDDIEEAEVLSDHGLRSGTGVLSPEVKRVLDIRSVLGSVSIKKLDRMLLCAGSDDRVRYSIQYHGAHTGRWGGRLFQPHNFPRGKIEGGHDPVQLVAAINTGDARWVGMLYGDPIAAVASGLRHVLVPAGSHLYCVGDFAGIEARVVLALAGQHDTLKRLAEVGSGMYLETAEEIYNIPRGRWSGSKSAIDKAKKEHVAEYTVGKNTVLACGFQMGWEKFQARYCPEQSEAFARSAINLYRGTLAPRVVDLWYALEDAAVRAVYTGERVESYGMVFHMEKPWLAVDLPDGQIMWYFTARPCPGRFGKDAWECQVAKNGRMQWVAMYGGLITENLVQKIARGLLCEAMFRLEANGFPIVLTVHDDITSEPHWMDADQEAFEQIMAESTPYSRSLGLPLAVEGWCGDRWRK